jgi:hypothetical protein
MFVMNIVYINLGPEIYGYRVFKVCLQHSALHMTLQ